eukprot:7254648-Pyramimonas_sp.AAC.1
MARTVRPAARAARTLIRFRHDAARRPSWAGPSPEVILVASRAGLVAATVGSTGVACGGRLRVR